MIKNEYITSHNFGIIVKITTGNGWEGQWRKQKSNGILTERTKFESRDGLGLAFKKT